MKFLWLILLFSLFMIFANAQTPIRLWEGDAPNANGKEAIDIPTITPYPAPKDKATGAAIVVLPGGGYRNLSDVKEGSAVAEYLNSIGITAFVLKYRIPNDATMKNKSIAPLQDAQKAILTVRERAKEWNLNPNKIGIVGLSAGGHLASTVGTHFDNSYVENSQNISLRPDFMVLIYPVITMEPWGGPRTRANLIGKEPTQSLIDFFSTERHVTSNTPPTFLLHTTDDERISVRNSLVFYDALRAAKVKTEMHLLQNGGHGFGVEHPTRKDEWVKWCVAWIKENGF